MSAPGSTSSPPKGRRSGLRKVLGGLALLGLAGGIGLYLWWPKREAIPEKLEAIDESQDPAELVFPAQGAQPAFDMKAQRGNQVLVVLVGREVFMEGEGMELLRALDRWTYPEGTQVVTLGDAAGFGFFRKRIEEEFLPPMRKEARFPLYVDFEGSLVEAFKLPRGRLGLALFDAEGNLAHRHSGPADEPAIEALRVQLNAQEPQPGPAWPEALPELLAAKEFDITACKAEGQSCFLAFVSRPVKDTEIPGHEGWEGEMEEAFKALSDPDIRLLRTLSEDWILDPAKIPGRFFGSLEGVALQDYQALEDDPALRSALGLQEQSTAMVLLKEGRVEMSLEGSVPFWRYQVLRHHLGVESRNRRGGPGKGKDGGGPPGMAGDEADKKAGDAPAEASP